MSPCRAPPQRKPSSVSEQSSHAMASQNSSCRTTVRNSSVNSSYTPCKITASNISEAPPTIRQQTASLNGSSTPSSTPCAPARRTSASTSDCSAFFLPTGPLHTQRHANRRACFYKAVLFALAWTYFARTQHATSKRSNAPKPASRNFSRSRDTSISVKHASHETTAPVKVRGSLVQSPHATVSRTKSKSRPAFSGDATLTSCEELQSPPLRRSILHHFRFLHHFRTHREERTSDRKSKQLSVSPQRPSQAPLSTLSPITLT